MIGEHFISPAGHGMEWLPEKGLKTQLCLSLPAVLLDSRQPRRVLFFGIGESKE